MSREGGGVGGERLREVVFYDGFWGDRCRGCGSVSGSACRCTSFHPPASNRKIIVTRKPAVPAQPVALASSRCISKT